MCVGEETRVAQPEGAPLAEDTPESIHGSNRDRTIQALRLTGTSKLSRSSQG